jgi:hypothetical protein
LLVIVIFAVPGANPIKMQWRYIRSISGGMRRASAAADRLRGLMRLSISLGRLARAAFR